MRLHQQIRASIAHPSVICAAALMFVSGMPMSAFGQTPTTAGAASSGTSAAIPAVRQPTPPRPSPVANGTPLSIDDAVKMALENNLGIQEERMNPEIQAWALSRATAVYAPNVISSFTRGNSASPPQDFLSVGVPVVTSASLFSSAGLQQQTRWGGGYQLTFDGSRGTSDAPHTVYPLNLKSNVTAAISQPLLRNFAIDSLRLNIQQTRIQQSITDLQLTQRITQTARNTRAAYYGLVGAIAGLKVAQESLDLAKRSYEDNKMRVEVGTMAKIDIVTSEAEVASNEEAVIIAEASIQSAEDQLRSLVMNPSQAGFWTSVFNPVDEPTMTPRNIDVDLAVKNALENRTDVLAAQKQLQSTDATLKYAANQKLPGLDLQARYNVTGQGGTINQYDDAGISLGTANRPFTNVLHDVFANDFRTWSVALNFSYPIGTSPADALAAQSRIQRKQEETTIEDLKTSVTTAIRDAARQVTTNLKRVEVTTRARDLAQQRLEAENKRFNVGLSSTFELLQAQRDLSAANQRQLQATIDYNVSLVNFEAIQIAPVNGR
jgi:outer membrane protein TolC